MFFIAAISFAVPPHPLSYWKADGSFPGVSEDQTSAQKIRGCGMPDSILVLRCQFSDVSFDLDPEYPSGNPDTIPHDDAYFERILYHLSSYWQDVSHGHYDLSISNFHLHPEVYTLTNEMGYYGDDELSNERVSELIIELLDMADPEIDFNDYDSFIIFHAGAGQEADISGNNQADLWTTFVTRKSLQDGIDPDNDDFLGLEYDGRLLKEFVLLPETEKQPDITSGDPVFGLLGVVCHEFGRQMGLPTLYDNQSSNGKSAGIGNYGVMGTGLWNAAGFVPPLPCAWSRIYMGWEIENLVVIDQNAEDLELLYSLDPDGETPTIYRVMISEDEYFLLENRRQNPDGSTFVNANGDTLATFTFGLVENQEYYPEGHAYAGQPYFNFMENSYLGCEWDFYLPGHGEGDALDMDGSGICIWHVDELVMAEKFNLEEEINVPNGEEEHKAVDLEEADRDQGLDLYGYYGNRDDTYRAGNNDYFGYQEHNGLPWTPTAESYYGGIQLEIYGISASDSIMTFSVGYEWSLDSSYIGSNPYPAAFLDFGNGEELLFYAMLDGKLNIWENSSLLYTEELSVDTINQCWSWNDDSKEILIPAQSGEVARFYNIGEGFTYSTPELYFGWEWASPVMIRDDGHVILGMNSTAGDSCTVIFKDESLTQINRITISGYRITANMISAADNIFIPVKDSDSHALITMNSDGEYTITDILGEMTFEPEYAIYYEFKQDGMSSIVLTSSGNSLLRLIRLTSDSDWELEYYSDLPFSVNSYPSVADIYGDGRPELLLGGENGFLVMNEFGEFSSSAEAISAPDSAGVFAGVVAIDNGYNYDIAGMMSQNRLCVWENVANNNFVMKRDYPIAYGERSRNYPVVKDGFLYIAADNGKIFRDESSFYPEQDLPTEYADLQRTSCVYCEEISNQFETVQLFVDEETYVYPNPYSRIYSSAISGGTVNEGKIAVRVMLSTHETVKIKVYDIAGNQVLYDSIDPLPYLAYSYLIDADKLSSGVYFVKLEANSSDKLLKFGIEK